MYYPDVPALEPDELELLCHAYLQNNATLDPHLADQMGVKRGLRNADGSGVVAGLTRISDVHGYNRIDGRVVPDEGRLSLRGYSIDDLVNHAQAEDRFGYEEVAYLLLTGSLPNKEELEGYDATKDSGVPAGMCEAVKA